MLERGICRFCGAKLTKIPSSRTWYAEVPPGGVDSRCPPGDSGRKHRPIKIPANLAALSMEELEAWLDG